MKKIYLLSFLCCLSFAAYSQSQTYIFANALSTTFKTGYATSGGGRFDNTIYTTGATSRGYAVFDLSSIPAGATISDVEVGYYVNFYGGSGAGGTWDTYGYAGDLSTVTVPATLFADMVAGTPINATSYGVGVALEKLPTTPAAVLFVQANIGSKVSVCWTNGGTRAYQITGETGSSAPGDTITLGHAPYIRISYCLAPTGVTATAAPTTLCAGDNLTLTGTATGATSYSWSGPGAYTSTLLNPAVITSALTSAGVYTLTAINSCGSYSATATAITAAVTVNPLPSAITGTNTVCVSNGSLLSSAPTGGTWSSSNSLIATIGSGDGLAVGVAAGTVNMSYTLSTGCHVIFPFTVNNPPGAIFGPTAVCVGNNITLFDGVSGGTWSSSAPGTGSVGGGTGVVTGISAGTATITYVTTGCNSVTHDITVNPLPSPIAGPGAVCALSTINLTDPTSGGNWSSSNITLAMVGSSTGIVTGVSAGAVNIFYADGITGCRATKAIVVNALPAAIGGPTDVCAGLIITLTETSPGGSFTGGAPNASVTAPGVVTGITAGSATITYTIAATGCLITDNIYVDPSPSPIAGTLLVCANATTMLTDPDAGGHWTSAATGTATVGSSTGIVTGVAAGTTNISYTMPAGCSAVAIVTVNPAPSGIVTASGPTTFCAGSNVVLTGAAGAGYTYQWSAGGTPLAGATNMTYTAISSGSYTVDVTNTFGCVTTSAATIVTAGFSAVADHSTPLNFCIGDHVILSANTGSAVGSFTYQWQLNGVNIPFATSINYSATANGVYTCIVNITGVSGSCSTTTPAVTVIVNPLPTPSINFTGTTLYTGVYSGYLWYLNGVGVTGANSQLYVPVANGIYRVRVTDGIGCGGFSSYFNVSGVGVPQINTTSIEIYPNPATDIVNIVSPNKVRTIISNVEGQKLLEETNAGQINISSLATGLYIIKIYDENGQMLVVQKLIKQ